MKKFNLKIINHNFFFELIDKIPNWYISDFNYLIIGWSHQSQEEKTKLIFVKDKSKVILALIIEWSYEEVHNNYA